MAAWALAGARLAAQTATAGTINFLTQQASGNPDKVVDARVTGLDGAIWAGPESLAQLDAGLEADSLGPVGVAVSFLPSGYLSGVKVVTPLPPGREVLVQLRAWEAVGGPTYEAAVASGKLFDSSDLIKVVLGGAVGAHPMVPSGLIGMRSVQIVIPEPSIVTLEAGMVLLSRRRRPSAHCEPAGAAARETHMIS
jgi:hypothetical protein